MALNCSDFVLADIQKDCENPPVGGIEYNLLIVKTKDIDKAAVTFNGTNPLLMTNFKLLSGKTGVVLEGVKMKSNNGLWELVVGDYSNRFKHQVNGTITNVSAANKLTLQSLLAGERYTVILEKVWKGTSNAEAFEVIGYHSGLVAQAGTQNYNENSGVATIELASEGEMEEPYLPFTLLETDYATTKTAFNNKYAEA